MIKSCFAGRLICVVWIVVALMVGGLNAWATDPSPSSATEETPPLATIAGYLEWTRVNEEPHKAFDAFEITLCRAPVPTDSAHGGLGTHVVAYVNDLGREAMFAEKPAFPVGSIIVKAKLIGAEKEAKTELLTVMVKQKPGYDAEHGDWEYLALDGQATQIDARGKLENCRTCHLTNKESDYVFRDYLPADKRMTTGQSAPNAQGIVTPTP